MVGSDVHDGAKIRNVRVLCGGKCLAVEAHRCCENKAALRGQGCSKSTIQLKEQETRRKQPKYILMEFDNCIEQYRCHRAAKLILLRSLSPLRVYHRILGQQN